MFGLLLDYSCSDFLQAHMVSAGVLGFRSAGILQAGLKDSLQGSLKQNHGPVYGQKEEKYFIKRVIRFSAMNDFA